MNLKVENEVKKQEDNKDMAILIWLYPLPLVII